VLCSNLLPLRDFFLSGMYKDDINTDNPMGAGGKVAVAYARLLKEIWYDGSGPAVGILVFL
jgi:ubiquitin carboxyl-terminal hydrolase 4/11/15